MKYYEQVVELRRSVTEFASVVVMVPHGCSSQMQREIATATANALDAWGSAKTTVEAMDVRTIQEMVTETQP